MTEPAGITYRATLRRSEMVVPALVGLIAALIVGVWLSMRYVKGNDLMIAILSLMGSCLILVVVIAIAAFRVNSWTIQADGIRVVERPKVPLFGFHRRSLVRFQDISALRWLESGFDLILEIETERRHRHRMMKDQLAQPAGSTLEDFAEAIRMAARQSGCELPAISEGMSWWNTATGIAFVFMLFVISCVIAGGTGWALWDGMTMRAGSNANQAAAIALLLPFGSGYLLLKAVGRRRRILAHLRRP